MICTFRNSDENTDIIFNCDAEGQILQNFLTSDLQEDLTRTGNLLQHCKSSDISEFESTGNSYTLLINHDNFSLQNLYDDTEFVTGTRSYLTKVLQNWEAVLLRKMSGKINNSN